MIPSKFPDFSVSLIAGKHGSLYFISELTVTLWGGRKHQIKFAYMFTFTALQKVFWKKKQKVVVFISLHFIAKNVLQKNYHQVVVVYNFML